MNINWPDGLNEQVFLREYWQKKPLIIRQALMFDNPISADELAGLACEQDVHSRLIRRLADDHWTVEHGPFAESTLMTLPQTDWSLLISDVEKLLPDFRQYLQPFRFIPDWRIDDLMISYAPTGGSVGPHTDEYDVFLLQAEGSRLWQIATERLQNPHFIPDLEIKILSDFTAQQSHLLNAGDLLYLPPGFAHYGTSQDNSCMTWSFGFRAPSLESMLSDFVAFLAEKLPENALYEDPDLELQSNPGEITEQARQKLLKMLRDNLTTDETIFSEWIGRFLTETGSSGWLGEEQQQKQTESDFIRQLGDGQDLIRCSYSRLAYIRGDEVCTLFANGRAYPSTREAAELLCTAYRYSGEQIRKLTEDTRNLTLFSRLHQQSILLLES